MSIFFLKKVPDRDDTRDSATFCGTATLTRGRGKTGANKLKIWGWLNNFATDCRPKRMSLSEEISPGDENGAFTPLEEGNDEKSTQNVGIPLATNICVQAAFFIISLACFC